MINRTFAFPPAMLDRLDEMANESSVGLTAPDFLRQALAIFLERPTDAPFEIPLLSHLPTAPLEKALKEATQYVLSSHVAGTLEAGPGDFLVQFSGTHMAAEGIYNGSLVLLRPVVGGIMPSDDELALAQVVRDGKIIQARIGRWKNGAPPKMKETDGRDFTLTDGPFVLRPIARVRGVISRMA